jgi:hypothetical protein
LRAADFFRSLLRRRKRFHAAGQPADRSAPCLSHDTQALPGHGLQGNVELAKILSLLEPPCRAFWDELCRGKRLRDLPRILGVSYRTVKRRWRTLREQVRSAFRLLNEPVA